jgi:hypothetical protein
MLPKWLFHALCAAVYVPAMLLLGVALRPITNRTPELFGWSQFFALLGVFALVLTLGYIRNRQAGLLHWQRRMRGK